MDITKARKLAKDIKELPLEIVTKIIQELDKPRYYYLRIDQWDKNLRWFDNVKDAMKMYIGHCQDIVDKYNEEEWEYDQGYYYEFGSNYCISSFDNDENDIINFPKEVQRLKKMFK